MTDVTQDRDWGRRALSAADEQLSRGLPSGPARNPSRPAWRDETAGGTARRNRAIAA